MKTYKREVGALLITAGLVTLWWFTSLTDPELVKAYATSMPMIIVGLVAAGITPFGIDHIWGKPKGPGK